MNRRPVPEVSANDRWVTRSWRRVFLIDWPNCCDVIFIMPEKLPLGHFTVRKLNNQTQNSRPGTFNSNRHVDKREIPDREHFRCRLSPFGKDCETLLIRKTRRPLPTGDSKPPPLGTLGSHAISSAAKELRNFGEHRGTSRNIAAHSFFNSPLTVGALNSL
jgi:hypothetical protein